MNDFVPQVRPPVLPARRARMVEGALVLPRPLPRTGLTLLEYFDTELTARVRTFGARLNPLNAGSQRAHRAEAICSHPTFPMEGATDHRRSSLSHP